MEVGYVVRPSDCRANGPIDRERRRDPGGSATKRGGACEDAGVARAPGGARESESPVNDAERWRAVPAVRLPHPRARGGLTGRSVLPPGAAGRDGSQDDDEHAAESSPCTNTHDVPPKIEKRNGPLTAG